MLATAFVISTAAAPVRPLAAPAAGEKTALDGDNDLREHVGHRVDIEGDGKGDVEDGDLEIARGDDWTEMTEVDGRT